MDWTLVIFFVWFAFAGGMLVGARLEHWFSGRRSRYTWGERPWSASGVGSSTEMELDS